MNGSHLVFCSPSPSFEFIKKVEWLLTAVEGGRNEGSFHGDRVLVLQDENRFADWLYNNVNVLTPVLTTILYS